MTGPAAGRALLDAQNLRAIHRRHEERELFTGRRGTRCNTRQFNNLSWSDPNDPPLFGPTPNEPHPMTPRRGSMSIRILMVPVLVAALAACQSVEVRDDGEVVASEAVKATWNEGLLFMGPECNYAWLGRASTWEKCLAAGPPGVSGPQPAVVFLHGCAGWGSRQEDVMRTIQRNGYAVFAPDSFARPGRVKECGRGDLWGRTRVRLEEATYALARVRQLPWVDPQRLVLAGFSEGGFAVASYPHHDVRAILVLGWGCKAGLHVPASVPVLNVVGRRDDEISTGSSLCSMLGRPGSRAVNVDAGHNVADDPETTRIVGDFLAGVLAR